jgi:hypothetical protein
MGTMTMHANSLAAHASECDAGNLSKRCKAILAVLEKDPCYLGRTDRMIMAALGFTDPNMVRPRLTEMVKAGILEECGETKDPATGHRVRRVRIKQPVGNLELFQ